jgi:ribonuclease HI
VAFAMQDAADLYVGSLDGYSLPILQLPDETSLPKRTAGSAATKTKVAAYSYLSVINGVPMRHVTWADCEQRVKGQSGARFKKATSAAEEAAILNGWGIDPNRM